METIKLLRDTAHENIKKYCELNNCQDDFDFIKNDLMRQADEYNVKLPKDFYIAFYNQTVELLNS